MNGSSLEKFPVHLGLGSTAEQEPEFTGDLSWYQGYTQRHAMDGAEGRLVAMHSFTKPWDMWEMHPAGAEVVICIAGSIILLQETEPGENKVVHLSAGDYAINPPGVWHTADIAESATALFITAGLGTEHRAR